MKSGLCESRYERFDGKNVEQMPLLLEAGRHPLSMAGVMLDRITYGEEFPDWLNLYIDVSDLTAYEGGNGDNIKFVLTTDKSGRVTDKGREVLELINPKAKLTESRAIKLGKRYDGLDGENVLNLTRADLGVTDRGLTSQEVLDSKPWRIFARDPNEVPAQYAITKDEFQKLLEGRFVKVPDIFKDRDLLTAYRDLVFSKTGQNDNMGIYPDINENVAKLRAWFVGGFDYWSFAGSRSGLGYAGGRFVGLAPEALIAPRLEQVLALYEPDQNRFREKAQALFRRE